MIKCNLDVVYVWFCQYWAYIPCINDHAYEWSVYENKMEDWTEKQTNA